MLHTDFVLRLADESDGQNVTYPRHMRERDQARTRRPLWVLVGLVGAVAIVAAMAVWRPWLEPSVPVASGENAESAVSASTAELLTIEDTARVLVFGDSWVYGSAAIVPELGFAYRLGTERGWQVTVDGVRGSGYLKPGIDGPTYGERISQLAVEASPQLIVIEGSINDRRLYEPELYREAVTAAWDDLAELYPEASVVVLGPAPQVLPVEQTTALIDRDLAALAAERNWWYLSPIAESWITDDNYLTVIDTGTGNDHPSTEGHAYLAERVMTALDAITAPSTVIADAPLDPAPAGE